MILQMPHSFRWGDRAGVVISKILAESVYGRCQRLACYVPKSGGERQIRHFFSAFILMYTVSFIYLFFIIWPCDWRYYAYYLIFIEFASRYVGKVYPYARIKQRKYIKSPENLTKSVRLSGLFFLPPESVFKRVAQNNDTARKGSELMIRPTLRDCAKYARGPPKWIRTDSLWGGKTEKVNQIWFTPTFRPNAPCVGRMPRAAH